jgi:flagellar hook assembly protein FlgD
VHFILHDVATVKIVIRDHNDRVVSTRNLGTLGGGKYTRTVTAPSQPGKYTVQVVASQSCGQQVFSSPLKVR